MATIRDGLNVSNPNSLPILGAMLALGEAVNLVPKLFRGTVTANTLTLPDGQKAAKILRAYGQGGTSAFKTVLADGSNAAPAAGEVRVTGAGDILFAAADAITLATVEYLSPDGEVYEETLDVAANVATLNSGRAAVALLSATRVTGGAVGVCVVLARGSTPAAGQASISTASDLQIAFAGADAVTKATVRYLAVPGVGSTARKTVSATLRDPFAGV